MRRQLVSALAGVAVTVLVSSYFGYVDITVRAATNLRSERKYAESAAKLEGLLPFVWVSVYRQEVLLKLAMDYRELQDWESLRQTATVLESDYPGTVTGFYGTHFYADYLARGRHDYGQALRVYQGLLTSVRSRTEDDDWAFLRQSVFLEMARVYRQLGKPEEMSRTLDQLKSEYPDSPYLRIAAKELGR